MLKSLLIFSLVIVAIHADGKLSILDYPPSLEFKGNEKLDSKNLGDVLAASLGFYVNSGSNWPGLYVLDPFVMSESSIAVIVDGANEINLDIKAKTYNLIGDSAEDSLNLVAATVEAASSTVLDLDLTQGPEALQYSDILGEISLPKENKITSSLKPDLHSEDQRFLMQIAMLKALSKNLEFVPKRPNLLIVRMSLSSLATVHGENSPALSEAVKMLSNAVKEFEDTAKNLYKNDFLFTVVTNKNKNYSRSKRQADGSKANDVNDLNLATEYNEDYPVIFNIILWFGVVFFFSLLAVSYTIAAMDPGRDSIIYRMTSTRMKKDN